MEAATPAVGRVVGWCGLLLSSLASGSVVLHGRDTERESVGGGPECCGDSQVVAPGRGLDQVLALLRVLGNFNEVVCTAGNRRGGQRTDAHSERLEALLGQGVGERRIQRAMGETAWWYGVEGHATRVL